MELQSVGVNMIEAPVLETRFGRDAEAVEELAKSIAALGLLQPVVVVARQDGYRLVAGARRLQACRSLGWGEIPAVVFGEGDLPESTGTLVENLQRVGLNPVEEAVAFAEALRELDCSQEELAGRLNCTRSYIAKRLMLLDCDEVVLSAIIIGDLPWSHALELKRLPEAEDRLNLLDLAVKNGVTQRILHSWVNHVLARPQPVEGKPVMEGEPYIPPPPPRHLLECAVCGRDEDNTVLHVLWVCGDDARRLEKIRAGQEDE